MQSVLPGSTMWVLSWIPQTVSFIMTGSFQSLEYFFKSGEVTEKVKDMLTDHIIDNALLFTFTVNERHPFNGILKKG